MLRAAAANQRVGPVIAWSLRRNMSAMYAALSPQSNVLSANGNVFVCSQNMLGQATRRGGPRSEPGTYLVMMAVLRSVWDCVVW